MHFQRNHSPSACVSSCVATHVKIGQRCTRTDRSSTTWGGGGRACQTLLILRSLFCGTVRKRTVESSDWSCAGLALHGTNFPGEGSNNIQAVAAFSVLKMHAVPRPAIPLLLDTGRHRTREKDKIAQLLTTIAPPLSSISSALDVCSAHVKLYAHAAAQLTHIGIRVLRHNVRFVQDTIFGQFFCNCRQGT